MKFPKVKSSTKRSFRDAMPFSLCASRNSRARDLRQSRSRDSKAVSRPNSSQTPSLHIEFQPPQLNLKVLELAYLLPPQWQASSQEPPWPLISLWPRPSATSRYRFRSALSLRHWHRRLPNNSRNTSHPTHSVPDNGTSKPTPVCTAVP